MRFLKFHFSLFRNYIDFKLFIIIELKKTSYVKQFNLLNLTCKSRILCAKYPIQHVLLCVSSQLLRYQLWKLPKSNHYSCAQYCLSAKSLLEWRCMCYTAVQYIRMRVPIKLPGCYLSATNHNNTTTKHMSPKPLHEWRFVYLQQNIFLRERLSNFENCLISI